MNSTMNLCSHSLEFNKGNSGYRLAMFDIDGLAQDSEPYIQECIIMATKAFAIDPSLEIPENILAEIRATFGQADDKMSLDLFNVLKHHQFYDQVKLRKFSEDAFVIHFAEERVSVWQSITDQGKVPVKPGFHTLLENLVQCRIDFGVYTSMPRSIAEINVKRLFVNLFLRPQEIVSCDDARLIVQGKALGKPHPRGWQVLIDEFQTDREVAPILVSECMVFEDRASGAVGALRAGVGKVIVVPDPSDGNTFEGNTFDFEHWDKKRLIRDLVAENPSAVDRIVFLKSLENINFVD